MSAIEKQYQTCLPPEAYIRIIRSAQSDALPKFKSSVYPPKQTKTKTKNK
jgi:hypothetical protein